MRHKDSPRDHVVTENRTERGIQQNPLFSITWKDHFPPLFPITSLHELSTCGEGSIFTGLSEWQSTVLLSPVAKQTVTDIQPICSIRLPSCCLWGWMLFLKRHFHHKAVGSDTDIAKHHKSTTQQQQSLSSQPNRNVNLGACDYTLCN